MRFILDIDPQPEGRVTGRVQAESAPEAKTFTGWLELLAFIEPGQASGTDADRAPPPLASQERSP